MLRADAWVIELRDPYDGRAFVRRQFAGRYTIMDDFGAGMALFHSRPAAEERAASYTDGNVIVRKVLIQVAEDNA